MRARGIAPIVAPAVTTTAAMDWRGRYGEAGAFDFGWEVCYYGAWFAACGWGRGDAVYVSVVACGTGVG
jgi:hypothetical protein